MYLSTQRKKCDWHVKWPLWVDHIGHYGDWVRRGLLDKAILSLLGPLRKRKVLDIGCGEGRLARILARLGAKVAAVDIVPELINLCVAISTGRFSKKMIARWPWLSKISMDVNGASIKYYVADVTSMIAPFQDNFNAVVSCCSLNDFPDLQAAVFSLSRMLKARGICVIAIPNPSVIRPLAANGKSDCWEGNCIEELISPRFSVTNYYRPLTTIVRTFAANQLFVERIVEPLLGQYTMAGYEREIRKFQHLRRLPDPMHTPWFTVIRFRKN